MRSYRRMNRSRKQRSRRSNNRSRSRSINQRGGKHGRAAAYREDKTDEGIIIITIFVAVYWFFSRMMYNTFAYVGGNVDPGGMG